MFQLVFAAVGGMLFAVSLAVFLVEYATDFSAAVRITGTPGTAAAIDIALFSLFALHHSLLARSGAKATVRRLIPPGLERSAFTWISSALFLLVCLTWQRVAGVAWRLPGSARYAGYAVQLAGLYLTVRGSARLDVLDLAGVRQVIDPAHGAAHVPLETRGVYGIVRHPLYLGWVLVVGGAPDMTMTRLVFAIVSTAYLILAVPFEERGLIATFGPEYRAYQRRTRFRIVPGIW